MIDLACAEGLVNVVAGGDNQRCSEDEGEDCKGCGIEDAEEGDTGAFGRELDMHGKDRWCIVVGWYLCCM